MPRKRRKKKKKREIHKKQIDKKLIKTCNIPREKGGKKKISFR